MKWREGNLLVRRYHLVEITAGLVFITSLARAADYIVDPTGVRGHFRTIQAAHDAIAGQTAQDRAHILIVPGIYHEQLRITKPHVSLIGLGKSPAAVRISFDGVYVGGETVSIAPTAAGFVARNLTFENAQPHQKRVRALAVRSMADRAIFDNARFLGYQDTLMLDGRSRQYLCNCFISGDVDFIFGEATAVFDHCTVESTDRGFITAANTRIALGNPTIPADDQVFLGRPWYWYAPHTNCSVIFIRTKMGPHICRKGWDPWDVTGDPAVDPRQDRDPHTRYSEFGSMDLNGSPLPLDDRGVPIGRVPWQDPMTAEHAANYTLENIFGPARFWNETTQPETSGAHYVDIGPPWNPLEQIALLPATDSM
jgi:pectinesterase